MLQVHVSYTVEVYNSKLTFEKNYPLLPFSM